MSTVFVIGSLVASCTVNVERFPKPGESLLARDFIMEPGGKGFNLLLGAHRLGVRVDGILPIGDDLFGTMAPLLLEQAGLPVNLLWQSPGPSGGGVGFIDASGETSLAVAPGANFRLTHEAITSLTKRIQAAKIVAAQFETSDEAIIAAFHIARRAGIRTFFNPSPYRPLSAELLTEVSILAVNQTEAEALALDLGITTALETASPTYEALANQVLNSGPEVFILTRGNLGAMAWTREGITLHQKAFEANSIDCLGAGDAFNAGFIVALIEQKPLALTLQYAAACGALATEKQGVLYALPSASDVYKLIEQRKV